MQTFLEKNKEQVPIGVINQISEHPRQLKNSFEQYFATAR